jgi:DNA-binding winged helix-turn-helix (wHTH) protein/tetratricopeptide (TPR) repeat protein
MLYSFEPFELDLATFELRRDGQSIALQPRVFGVLRYLIEHRDRVVSKQELIDALWGGSQLNAVAVPWTINRARKALGDEPNGDGFIETLRGHGYRFTGDVQTRSAEGRTASEPQQPSAAVPTGTRPFVGREPTMQQLSAALDAAAEGSGALYLLSGEPGIGKTRCAEEFALVARRYGSQVWIGRCFQHGSAPAFWPFIQVLRAACTDATLHDRLRSEGLSLLQEIEPRPQEAQQATPLVSRSDGERFWLLDRLSRWLCRTAHSHVRVIELEDIHCADESSLQVLSLLAPLLRQARILLLATARDGGARLPRSAAALAARMRPCEHVELTGLGSADIEAYLRALWGEQLALELARPLAEKTAGNPLFLHEISRVVSAQSPRAGSVVLSELPLPAAVTEIISARLRELDAQTRSLLDAACVVGEEFGTALLQRASRLPASDVLAGLETATLADIVEQRRDTLTHAFVHPLMREVLYGALSAKQRAYLHAAVGEALEALDVAEPSLYELAYHFHHAPLEGCYERAKRYSEQAGYAALHALAYDEAVQCYAWALEAQRQLAPDDVRGTCDLLLISAGALLLAGRSLEARNYCQRVFDLASQANLPDVLVRAARQSRPSVWFAHIPGETAVQALELSLRLLPESASPTRARAYANLALFPPYSLNVEACQSMSAEAVRLANELKDPQLLAEVHASRLFGLCGPASSAELLSVADKLLERDPRQHLGWAVDAHIARYHAFMQRGDGAKAEQALDNYESLARQLRLPFLSWHCDRLRAQRMVHAGQLDAAEQRLAALWAESQRMQLPLALNYYVVNSKALHWERTGRHHSDPGVLQAAPWVRVFSSFRARQILVAIDDGELATAAAELRAMAEDDFAAATGDVFALASLTQLATAAVALADREAAFVLRERLAPYAELSAITVFINSLGSVSRYLGLLDGLLGERAQAQSYFERAIELNARSGHALERLRSSLALARVLAQGRPSERAQARKLAQEVDDTAFGYGAVALASAARELYAADDAEPRTGAKARVVRGPK